MRPLFIVLLLLLAVPVGADELTPMDPPKDLVTVSSAFSYQGRLNLSGIPVDGTADLRFTLHDAAIFGSTVGASFYAANVPVNDGLFTVQLDFGAGVFTGDARWIAIEARTPHDPGNSLPMTLLTPRQEITAVPYALHAMNGGGSGSGLWQLQGGAIVNIDGRFVGVNRSNSITSAEKFGVHSGITAGYAGMYISTTGNDGLPFYGYSAGSSTAWSYFHGPTLDWRLFNGGDRLTVARNGNVGIGTNLPGARLTVNGLVESLSGGFKFPDGTVQITAGGGGTSGSQLILSDAGMTTFEAYANDAGSGGSVVKLYSDNGLKTIELDGKTGSGGAVELWNRDARRTVHILGDYYTGKGALVDIRQGGGSTGVRILGNGGFGTSDRGGEIQINNAAGSRAVTIASNWGGTSESRIVVDVLEIKGGSDLSEQFDVLEGRDAIEPGTVVSIDPARPGALRMSREANDRRVAGIVSGAGGVRPGMLMGQSGTAADGEIPVALTGRVYCKVDASHGAIEPGDLLTTSSTPGYAMKVSDHAGAQGAILGKAMTGLESGQGLVLVLVSLQ